MGLDSFMQDKKDITAELTLRPASMDDVDILYEWRNDPEVRKWSFNTDEILYETHVQWLKSVLLRDDVEIYIMMENEIPVGQIRVTFCQDDVEIGYSIDKGCRGRNWGQKMITLMENKLRNDPRARRGGIYFVAYVKKRNEISKRIFERLNYQKEEQQRWIRYSKEIG